jgi:hypothetical protein
MRGEVKVYEVLYDGDSAGAAGDGTHIEGFRLKKDADRFARDRTCYGQAARVMETFVPRRIAERWGVA